MYDLSKRTVTKTVNGFNASIVSMAYDSGSVQLAFGDSLGNVGLYNALEDSTLHLQRGPSSVSVCRHRAGFWLVWAIVFVFVFGQLCFGKCVCCLCLLSVSVVCVCCLCLLSVVCVCCLCWVSCVPLIGVGDRGFKCCSPAALLFGACAMWSAGNHTGCVLVLEAQPCRCC